MNGRPRRSFLPPRLVRRLVLAPVVPVVTVLGVAMFPLEVAVFAAASRYLPGHLKPLRLSWMLLVWMLRESIGVLMLFALWVASGFGWWLDTPLFRRQHLRLMGWYLWGVVGVAQRALGLRVVTELSPGALAVEPHVPPRPVLILSRHAGAGDSLVLAHELVNTYGRAPSLPISTMSARCASQIMIAGSA